MKTLTLLLTLLFTGIMADTPEEFNWPIDQLDTARDVDYLSDAEKDVILEMNKVRYNPSKYADEHLKWMRPFYSGKILKIPGKTPYQTAEGISALNECIEVLKKTEPAPILKPSSGMTKACEQLVYDQSATGKTGHRGSDRSTPIDRLNSFGSFTGYFAENIHYGDTEPRFIVISLLIDDNVKSRGHRENILSQNFNYSGVAIGNHKTYGGMCVINYATNFEDE